MFNSFLKAAGLAVVVALSVAAVHLAPSAHAFGPQITVGSAAEQGAVDIASLVAPAHGRQMTIVASLDGFSFITSAQAQETAAPILDSGGGWYQKIFGMFENFPAWLAAITTVLTAMTAITAITPTKHDNTVLNILLKIANFLAGNVGKNKNADAV